ncbi:MAG TPA: NAD(P)-dependent oxidoreductase [Rectinema sp.]|jgi:3-hydroxyisobutyrate dehydrogenase|nr:NAD(P)-dependent oxidoreductase [Rectinema sp.]HOM93167.1 NAD(P)-dependent oxidoreductase [Rectinema sp.]HOR48687.1 NAD(P)-dependent oxidoreductase [Rectinema sp.]HPL71690.1 NAD(P)-dependent oxidoreductase [Rectinema sp.]HQO45899.1 NAD(P)-dependent oxidoreductase [Rectinema sp.]
MAQRTIGFIGLGVMGAPMAGHIRASGERLLIYTRTKSKARLVLDTGAEWRDSPKQIAEECDVVFTMVGYPKDVEEIYFGPDGLIENARPGTIFVDFTTSRPDLAVKIYESAKARGLSAIDAPVSGGDIGAKNATLTIMVGGDEETFQKVKPLLETVGKTVILQGGPGAGQHTKMANQIAVAGNLLGTVEALIYAKNAGLDPKHVLLSIANGAAQSWQLSNNAPRMLERNFDPGFYIKHFLKDLRIALDSAHAMHIELPMLALSEKLFAKMVNEGMGELGTQAIYLLYERGLA